MLRGEKNTTQDRPPVIILICAKCNALLPLDEAVKVWKTMLLPREKHMRREWDRRVKWVCPHCYWLYYEGLEFCKGRLSY